MKRKDYSIIKQKIKKALKSLEELKGKKIKVIEGGDTIVVVMSQPGGPGQPPPPPEDEDNG